MFLFAVQDHFLFLLWKSPEYSSGWILKKEPALLTTE